MFTKITHIVESGMVAIMIISICFLLYRLQKKDGDNKIVGIGARVIQFTCITLIIPSIVILGLEGILQSETIATLIGGLIGYVLSGIGDFKNMDSQTKDEAKKNRDTSGTEVK